MTPEELTFDQKRQQFLGELSALPPESSGVVAAPPEPPDDQAKFWKELRTSNGARLAPPRADVLTAELAAVLSAWDDNATASFVSRSDCSSVQSMLRAQREQLLGCDPHGTGANRQLDLMAASLCGILDPAGVTIRARGPVTRTPCANSRGSLATNRGTPRVPVASPEPSAVERHGALLQFVTWLESLLPWSRDAVATVSDSGPAVRTLAVMFTDMASSSEFAAKFGSLSAYQKRKQHNALLVPLISAHRGTLVEIVGDAMLAIFDEVADAARCAIAMQRRLAEYNRSDELDVKDFEIHIRAGIHYGKAVVYREAGWVKVVGQAVNVAARVESGAGKETDRILLSDTGQAQLLSKADEFVTAARGTIEAKGIGQLALHRMLWRDEEIEAARNQTSAVALAAKTGADPSAAPDGPDTARAIHGIFLDPGSGRGFVVPVHVRVIPTSQPGRILARVACDKVMDAAAKRAVKSAFDVLRRLGFEDALAENHAVEWWADGPETSFRGPSLGLAIALATVAAYCGIETDPCIAVTGGVYGEQIIPVVGVGGKWNALRVSGKFHTLIVPTGNLAELPNESRRDQKVRLIDVPTVEAAVLDILGPALGLTGNRLSALDVATASTASDKVDIQLWVEPAERRGVTRDITIASAEDVNTWYIGDRVRVCARVNRDCHLALVNVGTSGKVTVLIPNKYHRGTAARTGEVVAFPGPNIHFELLGPPGRERLIAIASDQPLSLRPKDFDQSSELICALPTTRDIRRVADDIAGKVRGTYEIDFYVSAGEMTSSPLPTAMRGRLAETSEFRPLDLG